MSKRNTTPALASFRPRLVDVGDASPTQAAFIYAANGVPSGPFNPESGKGKDCGNILGDSRNREMLGLPPKTGTDRWYDYLTTDPAVLEHWLRALGEFQALATSPGAIGWVVIDTDKPDKFPKRLRTYLEDPSVPFVLTRPDEHPRRGHYWFRLPNGVVVGNPTFKWGEVRGLGGGIVLPPYGARYVARAGQPPILPDELLSYITSQSTMIKAGAGGGGVDLDSFIRRHRHTTDPRKINGLPGLYRYQLDVKGLNPYDAMKVVLIRGLRESVVGWTAAGEVIGTLQKLWNRRPDEFLKLARAAANIAENSDPGETKAIGERTRNTGLSGAQVAT